MVNAAAKNPGAHTYKEAPMSYNAFGAKIKVIGVGGGGGNAVNTMIKSGLEGVEFIVANTDAQALKASLASHKIQLGKDLTKGLGAGADPDIGRDAALEDRMELQECLSDADMVFITAGMGGGTGTGAAAVVAQIARELGALTVAVVTKPFAFEGKRRRKHAEQGVGRLRECVDTLITIPNQRLLQVATPDLSMLDAFKLADNVLVNAVRGISDIINTPGLINVDFADVKTVMSSMGHALMGIGYGAGTERALLAAKQAISSPLLEDVDIEGATGILINITAGTNVSIMEVNNACMVIQEAAHEDANIIFGAVIDETLGDDIRITVIATGFPVEESASQDDVLHGGMPSRSAIRTSIGGHPMPQRLITPPRLTSHAPSTTRDRSSTHGAVTPSMSPSVPPVQRQPANPAALPRSSEATASQVAPSFVPSESIVTMAPSNPAADEAAQLAAWSFQQESAPEEHMQPAAVLESLEISRSVAPGTPVFSPTETSTKASVADLVFSSDHLETQSQISEELSSQRAGAMVASEDFVWDFDAPTADLVSNEIDRRIDEAMALAGRFSNDEQATEQSNVSGSGSGTHGGLDLDDLDLPAFLRVGSDSKRSDI
jgi:cell division protein FtsZ